MTGNKTFQTRIQLKYDSFENWMTNDPVLLAGEVAVATVGTTNGTVNNPNFQNLPNIVLKVGDGVTRYSQLKFVSGLAADVYEWAKAENKPTYAAAEIKGLTEFVQNISDVDTNTEYQLVVVDAATYKYKLQKRVYTNNAWGEWTDTETLDLSAIDNRLDDVEAAIAALGGENGGIKEAIKTAIESLDYTGYVAGEAEGQTISFVGTVSESDGIVSAAKRDLVFTDAYSTSNPAATKKYVDDKVKDVVDDVANAMHFEGVVEGDSFEAAVAAADKTWEAGDIVIYGTIEYVYDGKKWYELGDETTAGRLIAGLDSDNFNDVVVENENSVKKANPAKTITRIVQENGIISSVESAEIVIDSDHVKVGEQTLTAKFDSLAQANAASHTDLQSKIDTNKTAIATLNGAASQIGSVAHSINTAIQDLDSSAVASSTNNDTVNVLTAVKEENGVISKEAEVNLSKAAQTGLVSDLLQEENTYIVFNCGSASVNI